MQNNINRSLIAAKDLPPLQYKTFSYHGKQLSLILL